MNKKGSVADSIFVPIYLIIIAATIFIAFYVWGTFQANMSPLIGSDPNITPAQNTTIQNAMISIQNSFIQFDYVFPFLVVGLMIVSLIFAFKTGSSVLYAFISLIFWAFALLISSLLTNIFGQFELSFPTVANTFTIITFLMNNMKWIVLAWLFLISVVMFSRNKREQEAISASEAAFG